jgi:hypothetical protein
MDFSKIVSRKTIQAFFQSHCAKNPHMTLEDLYRGICQIPNEATMADVYMIVSEKSTDNSPHPIGAPWSEVIAAASELCVSDLVGSVTPNMNEAKRISERVIAYLSDGIVRSKDAIIDAVLPDVDFDADAQSRVDFLEATRILYTNPNIVRLTGKGEIAKKNWSSLQYKASK